MVTAAEKVEFDFAPGAAVWMMPGNRTKNGLLHRVPLPPLAAAEFSRAIASSPVDSPFVFASQSVKDDVPILATTVTRAMSRLMAELKIVGVSPHDLRRTVGTELARLEIPLHVRKLVLNHSPRSRDVTDTVYNRYAYDKEKREALTGWEAHLSRIISPAVQDVAA